MTIKSAARPRDKHLARVLRAAQEEFSKHGLNGARMQAIADRAGLPKANVHYYFKSKASLYMAVLDRILETWNNVFDDVAADDDPAVALDNFIRQKVRLSFEDPSASRLFANEIIQGAPYLSGYLQKTMSPWVAKRAAIIQSWIDAGRMPETDPVLLIFMIWATTQHYADFQAQVLSILDKPDYDQQTMDRISNFASRTILAGCGLTPLKEST